MTITLNATELLEALKHLSTTNRSLHGARINREFRLMVITLTFFALCVSAKLTDKIPTTGPLFTNVFSFFDLFVCIVFIITVSLVWFYLKSSASANKGNQSRAEIAEDVIKFYIEENEELKKCDLLNEFKKRYDFKSQPNPHPCKNQWLWEAIIITIWALFSVVFIIVP